MLKKKKCKLWQQQRFPYWRKHFCIFAGCNSVDCYQIHWRVMIRLTFWLKARHLHEISVALSPFTAKTLSSLHTSWFYFFLCAKWKIPYQCQNTRGTRVSPSISNTTFTRKRHSQAMCIKSVTSLTNNEEFVRTNSVIDNDPTVKLLAHYFIHFT